MSFRCGRFGDVLSLVVYVEREAGYLMKIGTYPSLRDFHKDDIKKYDKVLTEQQKLELVTAITIANNGVGIGSYVYLRSFLTGLYSKRQRELLQMVSLRRMTLIRCEWMIR